MDLPLFEIASELKSSLNRISAIIRSLLALLKKAARDKKPMDQQDLVGIALILETLDVVLSAGKQNLRILLKKIAEIEEEKEIEARR